MERLKQGQSGLITALSAERLDNHQPVSKPGTGCRTLLIVTGNAKEMASFQMTLYN